MPLDWLFGKQEQTLEESKDEYVELDAVPAGPSQSVKIRVVTLNEFGDVETVQNYLRDDDIVWVKIKPLKDKDMTDLKRAIDRLKKTVSAINGDVAGIDDDWLIACPSYASVHR